MDFRTVANDSLTTILFEHPHEWRQNWLVTHPNEFREVRTEMYRCFLQMVVWDLCKEVMHLMSTDAVQEIVSCTVVSEEKIGFTYCGLNKMADIFNMHFFNFRKFLVFWLRVQWSLFQRVYWITSQHWSRYHTDDKPLPESMISHIRHSGF